MGSPFRVFTSALKCAEVQARPPWAEQIKRYLDAFASIGSSSRIFTTHEKALQLSNKRISTYVFDEDPVKSLLRTTEVERSDVLYFLDALKEEEGADYRALESHLESVLAHSGDSVAANTLCSGYPKEVLDEVLLKMPVSFQCPVEVLFTCCGYLRGTKGSATEDSIHCIETRALPADRKCIVLSATADEQCYRALFGDRLEFVDLGETETRGRLVCHTKKGYARSSVRGKLQETADEVVEEQKKNGFQGIITYKAFVENGNGGQCLRNTGGKVRVFATFGALAGLDAYGGKDMAVFGTPHLDAAAYRLYAHALGIPVPPEGLCFKERTVRRNGFEFSFSTCSEDSRLADLQLSLIEAELMQAVGRARLVNRDCTVHVYSNLPLPGAELA